MQVDNEENEKILGVQRPLFIVMSVGLGVACLLLLISVIMLISRGAKKRKVASRPIIPAATRMTTTPTLRRILRRK